MVTATDAEAATRPSSRADADRAATPPQTIFEQFFAVSPDMLCIAGFDGRFQRLNRAWENVLGYPAAEMLDRSNLDFLHPDDQERTRATLTGLTQDLCEVVGFENRYRSRDGAFHWLLWSAASDPRQGLIFAVAKDITARKGATAEARAEVRHLATVVGASEDAIFTKDRDSIITTWNRGARDMYGYTAAETVGQPVAILVPAGQRGEDRQILERVLAGEEIAHYETSRRRKDGKLLEVSLTVSALRDAAGNVVGAASVARDITERRRAAEVVLAMKEERHHGQELEAANRDLEAFSYSVSHDLRAPLRTISGFGAILESTYGAEMPEEAQRYLDLIQKGARDMGQLIDDLLAFARLGRQVPTRRLLEPAEVARRALKDLSRLGTVPAAAVSFGPMPACQADPALLRQVYLNLLSNALKFTRDRPTPLVEVGFLRGGAGGRGQAGAYFVRDNGVGFDARYAHKLFGVFQRLHRAEDYEGTGVGLAIVERIVSRHGGEVWAESVLDEGAVFYFTLGEDR